MQETKPKKKKSFWRGLLGWIGTLLIIVVILIAGGLLFLTLNEYRPEPVEDVELTQRGQYQAFDGSLLTRDFNFDYEFIKKWGIQLNEDFFTENGFPLRVVSWNLGYGALGETADFFMDGGKSVETATEEEVRENLEAMLETMHELEPQLLLLQEVDYDSQRSSYLDESKMIQDSFLTMAFSEAKNFSTVYVPYPIPPIGKVDSGLLTGSYFMADSAQRISLPNPFPWPIRLANLKRCLNVMRIPIKQNGKELVLVNLHLEAYEDGSGREAQSRVLMELLEEEKEKGNYVICGGDFNQSFSSVDLSKYPQQEGKWETKILDLSMLPDGYIALMDDSVPTCRSLDQPYAGADKDSFQYYVIDGFIISDNFDKFEVQTQDLGFVHSDHNPVVLDLVIKP